MLRAGFGIFHTRVPQLYESAAINDNGLTNSFLSLDNTDFYQNQVFPSYPNPAFQCPRGATSCTLPASLQPYATAEIAAFAPNFPTPRTGKSDLGTGTDRWFHGHLVLPVCTRSDGVDLIRARDVNLPPPTYYSYPIVDSADAAIPHAFYNVKSFATCRATARKLQYQLSVSAVHQHAGSAPYPRLGNLPVESAASSLYNGMTVSMYKRMSRGIHIRLAYTWAHAIDGGQDARVAGAPSTVTERIGNKK